MEQSSRNRASLAAFLSGLRVVGAGFGFLTYLILAKFLSPDGLGEVFAAFSLAAVGGTVASLGYAQIAVRFAARYRNKGKPGWFRGFVDQSTRQVVLVAIGLGVLIGAVLLLGVVSDAQSARFYLLACVAIPPIAVMNLYVGHAIGLRLFITSYLPEGFGRPLALLILIALTIVSGVSLTGSIVLWAFAMSSAFAALWVLIDVRQHLPKTGLGSMASPGLKRIWLKEASPLVAMVVFVEFFADIAILAAMPFLGSSDLAIFGLCLKLALLAGYFVQVAQQMATPSLADSRHARDSGSRASLLRESNFVPALFTFGALAASAIVGKPVLTLFHADFGSGYYALLILIFTQFIRALAGPASQILILRGSHHLNAALSMAAMLILIVSNVIFIPRLGLEGAAFAVLVTYAVWLIIQTLALRLLDEARVDIFAALPQRWYLTASTSSRRRESLSTNRSQSGCSRVG